MSIFLCLCSPVLRSLSLLVVLLVLCVYDPARAEGPPRAPDAPLFWPVPVALSPQCHFIGPCARFDAISLKVGAVTLVRGGGDGRFAAGSGLVVARLAFLDLVDLGAAFGGHLTHDEMAAFRTASMPALLDAKLRIWPLPWSGRPDGRDLQVAVAYQRALVSARLGAAEPPGFDTNTATLGASRSFGPVDLDAGAGLLWGSCASGARRAVQVSGSAALRLFGLARPIGPDEQLRVLVQAAYRFSVAGDPTPSDSYLLFGVEESTHSGYRFGLAAGPYTIGSQAGGLGMVTFSVAWGQRYRNPLAEWAASQPPWIPRLWMDLWHVDPVLEKDGCVWTDPAFYRMSIRCVGRPDPTNPGMILLNDGRRLPVGTHLWIRDDGMLITQRQEELAQVDAETAKRAILWQRFIWALRAGRDEKACESARSVLEEAQRSNVFALAAVMEAAPGLAIADWVNRAKACGLEDAMSNGAPLPPLGKLKGGGGMSHIPATKSPQAEGAEHTQPVLPARYKSQFLEENEKKGGHVLERHVGKTDEQLVARFRHDGLESVSTFSDERIAEAVIKECIDANQQRIAGWLDSSKLKLELEYSSNNTIGRGITVGQASVAGRSNARVVLKKDGHGGYYVLTAYTE